MGEGGGRVGIGLLSLLGEFLKADAALFEPAGDFGALRRVRPFGAKLGSGGAEGADFLGRIIGVADDAKLLPIRVQLVDQMRGDFDLAAIVVELAMLYLRWVLDRGRGSVVSWVHGDLLVF